MDYNQYYSPQSGHPPPNVNQNQHVGPQLQQQQQPQSGQMLHSQMPPQSNRQAMPPGPSSHHQHMQQQPQQPPQHMGHHHPQQMAPQHPNYHQVPPHLGPPVSHSNSPLAQHQQPPPQQPQQHHHNHQPTSLPGPLPQQSLSSQHMHPQSPHHHGGPPLHMQQQQPPQHQVGMNQLVRPSLGPAVMDHSQPGLQQQPIHHHHHHQPNFFSGGHIQQHNMHHYSQQNAHHPDQHQHHHQQPLMHHGPPQMGHPHIQPAIGRNSPYFPNILQTEFRIIELNRRLQCRPQLRHPVSPLPSPYDEGLWWERFASEFFEDDAILTLKTHEDKPVEYTIGRTLIPRFFRTYFDGGVTDLSINLRDPKEACLHPQMITLDCDQAFIITNNIFRHPAIAANQSVIVHTEGHLVLDFVSNNFDSLSIKSWRFYTRGSREYIDRSLLTNLGLSPNYLAEPVTRHGLTKSTISYLKMCMIMEPMQDLMFQHKQTKLDPRSCLRKLLFDRFKFRSGDDMRAVTSKRRKRKPSAAPSVPGATSKKTKANASNSMVISGGLNNNTIMSPAGTPPNFSLSSQDVMVVGEPSMMGGDFGDDNERMITRLENSQYDPTATTNTGESNCVNTVATTIKDTIDNGNNNDNETTIENHSISPSIVHHMQQPQQQMEAQQLQSQAESPQQQQLQPQKQASNQINAQENQADVEPAHQVPAPLQSQDQVNACETSAEDLPVQTNQINQTNFDEFPEMNQPTVKEPQQEQELQQDHLNYQPVVEEQVQQESVPSEDDAALASQLDDSVDTQSVHVVSSISQNQEGEQNGAVIKSELQSDQQIQAPQLEHNLINEVTKVNLIADAANNDSNMMIGIESVETAKVHANSVQTMNGGESSSNSQLPCSTATTTSAIEQGVQQPACHQPVDNGVA